MHCICTTVLAGIIIIMKHTGGGMSKSGQHDANMQSPQRHTKRSRKRERQTTRKKKQERLIISASIHHWEVSSLHGTPPSAHKLASLYDATGKSHPCMEYHHQRTSFHATTSVQTCKPVRCHQIDRARLGTCEDSHSAQPMRT